MYLHIETTGALHVHEEAVRSLYQALLLVDAGFVSRGRVQKILGLQSLGQANERHCEKQCLDEVAKLSKPCAVPVTGQG